MISEIFSSPDIAELAKAMLKVGRKLTPTNRDSENPFVKNRYASLNAVIASCRDILIEQGIWLVQYPMTADPGCLGLMTKLVHAESGQWQSSLMVMPLPKNDPQGYGSALTYARRYGLATLVGLVTEIDDDAEAATHGKKDNVRKIKAVPPEPVAELPTIDGIRYQTVKGNNGRLCVTASGSTQDKAAFLKQAGFRWDASRKVWWRYAQAA